MRLFIYEYTSAVEIGADPLTHNLRGEGWAMLAAVLDDFSRVPGASIVTLLAEARKLPFVNVTCRVASPGNEHAVFTELAAACDATLVIAPECNGILEERQRWIKEAGGQSLGSNFEAVPLCSDKLALGRHWHEHGIATPPCWLLSDALATESRRFPLVCKPRDGAGSNATFLVRERSELRACVGRARHEGWSGDLLAQPFVPGQAASVAFLIGPRQTIGLMPAAQHLTEDGRFHYTGGTVPLAHSLRARAESLARRAVESVPGLRGYVGVDLVLGEAGDGSQDWAIELNPRWTTSYIGLRALCEANLAEVLLKTLQGELVSSLPWRAGSIQFSADGRITRSSE